MTTKVQQFQIIANKISNLEKSHHIHILQMIKKHNPNIQISENSNGCFLNMNELNDLTWNKIKTYIEYNEEKDKEHKSYLCEKNDIIQNLIS